MVDALDFPIYNLKMVRAGAQYGKHLYLLKTSEFVKIGRSMDVLRRLGEHRRGNPWAEITLVAVFENSGFVEPWVLKALSQHEAQRVGAVLGPRRPSGHRAVPRAHLTIRETRASYFACLDCLSAVAM